MEVSSGHTRPPHVHHAHSQTHPHLPHPHPHADDRQASVRVAPSRQNDPEAPRLIGAAAPIGTLAAASSHRGTLLVRNNSSSSPTDFDKVRWDTAFFVLSEGRLSQYDPNTLLHPARPSSWGSEKSGKAAPPCIHTWTLSECQIRLATAAAQRLWRTVIPEDDNISITGPDGVEYLLKADEETDMLAWRVAIHQAAPGTELPSRVAALPPSGPRLTDAPAASHALDTTSQHRPMSADTPRLTPPTIAYGGRTGGAFYPQHNPPFRGASNFASPLISWETHRPRPLSLQFTSQLR
jgi:hypothetical protein